MLRKASRQAGVTSPRAWYARARMIWPVRPELAISRRRDAQSLRRFVEVLSGNGLIAVVSKVTFQCRVHATNERALSNRADPVASGTQTCSDHAPRPVLDRIRRVCHLDPLGLPQVRSRPRE